MSILFQKRRKFYYALIVPALILYACALLIPLFGGTIPYSFMNWNLMSGKKSMAGLENYVKIVFQVEKKEGRNQRTAADGVTFF